MGRPIDLTLDCTDARVMASFWKLALGYLDEPAPAPTRLHMDVRVSSEGAKTSGGGA